MELTRDTPLETLDDYTRRMAKATEEAQAALTKAADEMTQFYDRHQQDAPEYKQGDKVWLNSENLTTICLSKKLDHKWMGPYSIEKVITHGAYRLKLPSSFGRTHPVFSVTNSDHSVPIQ